MCGYSDTYGYYSREQRAKWLLASGFLTEGILRGINDEADKIDGRL